MSEDRFEAIAQETMQAADQVPCSPEEYREGLRTIIADLQLAIEVSEQDATS